MKIFMMLGSALHEIFNAVIFTASFVLYLILLYIIGCVLYWSIAFIFYVFYLAVNITKYGFFIIGVPVFSVTILILNPYNVREILDIQNPLETNIIWQISFILCILTAYAHDIYWQYLLQEKGLPKNNPKGFINYLYLRD